MKTKTRNILNSRTVFEVVLILLCVIIIVTSFLADLSVIPLADSIILKVENEEDLFFTLFSVQASIATLSIAIISIITGLTNETILGVSVSGYIAEMKPAILTHKRVIIANVLLSAINYVCVALTYYNLSIALFIISIILTLDLVIDVYVIFGGKQRIFEEIHSYIMSHYQASYLSDLNNEIANAIDSGNSLVLSKDVDILIEIFESEVKKSNYQCTDNINIIIKMTSDLFKKTVAQHNSTRIYEMLIMVCQIYEIANQNENAPMPLDLWEGIAFDFFRGVGELNYEQLTEEYICNRIHRALYKNLKTHKIGSVNTGLSFYSARLYRIISRANRFSKEQIYDLTRSIYENTAAMLYYGGRTFSDDEVAVLASEICYFHKVLIDHSEYKLIKNCYFDRHSSHSRGTKHELVFVITLIYLYYLACREKDKGAEQLCESARSILKENKKRITYFWMHIDLAEFVESYRGFIQNVMHDWEYMEELKAKWIQMEYIIDDFLVLSAINRFWDKESLKRIIQHITEGSMYSLYNRYFSSHRQNYVEEIDKDFCSYFTSGKATERDKYKYMTLLDVCNACYKEEQLREAHTEQLTEEDKQKFANESTQCISDYVEEIFECFAFYPGQSEADIVDIANVPIMTLTSHNSLFKEAELSTQIKDFYYASVMRTFLGALHKNIAIASIDAESQNKQKQLIELVEKTGVHGTIVIGNREEFWDEENQELLMNFTEKMHRIEHPEGYNHFYILDGRQIEFAVDHITVTFEDLSDEEIAERCRNNEDGTVSYNVTNELFIPFDKEEIKEFVHSTWKKAKVTVDIHYRLSSETVGAGIEMTTD